LLTNCIALPERSEKVKDCGTTNGHVGLIARTLMKDAREGLVR
jgi:tRNA1(Val) A37 N6-methylase TrmN6